MNDSLPLQFQLTLGWFHHLQEREFPLKHLWNPGNGRLVREEASQSSMAESLWGYTRILPHWGENLWLMLRTTPLFVLLLWEADSSIIVYAHIYRFLQDVLESSSCNLSSMKLCGASAWRQKVHEIVHCRKKKSPNLRGKLFSGLKEDGEI